MMSRGDPAGFGTARTLRRGLARALPATFVLLSSFLFACDDPNTPPIARASADHLLVDLGETVTLDGTASEDPDGDENKLQYTWEFTSKPAGSTCFIVAATSATASFSPDMAGSYQINLTVSDGGDSDADTVEVTVNGPPVAVAGSDQHDVPVNQWVELDGSESYDPEGNPLSYAWTFHSKPAGSDAVLSDPTSHAPSFKPDMGGTYLIELVVSDGRTESEPDGVTVTANAPPVAYAGEDQAVWVGDFVELDGSGSHDPDGDPLTYAWTFDSRPGGSAASLSYPTSKNPGFTPDVEGTFDLSLVVSDGKVDSDPSYVHIQAEIDDPPVADAGSYSMQAVGETVQLDGSGSSDPEGNQLTYEWALSQKPAGSVAQLSGPSTPTPTFTPDVGGSYQVRLIVNDGKQDSEPDFATIPVNSPPQADAGPDQATSVGSGVTLDGSGSWDPDGDDLTYAWSFSARPGGSTAQISGATTPSPTFTPDLSGSFLVQLVVSDGVLESAPDYVAITASDDTPTADAGPDQTVSVGTLVTLNGTGSHDPNGDPLMYSWSFDYRPAGSAAHLSNPSSATPSFTPDQTGQYVVRLVVSDGSTNSEPDQVTVTATPPAVHRIDVTPANPSIAIGGTVQLSAVARSSAGQVIPGVSFTWSSSNTSIATVDQSGEVTGVAEGMATISASASGVTGGSNVTVVPNAPTIQSVTPSPLVEGDPALITGTDFSPVPSENNVTVGGLSASVTAASTTQLHIVVPTADCQPPRTATLSVDKGGALASTQVTVHPASFYDLDVGSGWVFYNPDICLNLVGSNSEEEYLVGILSANEDPSNLTSAILRARTGIPLSAPSPVSGAVNEASEFRAEVVPGGQPPPLTFRDLLPASLQEGGWERNWEAEARIRQQERELIQSLGGLDRVKEVVQAEYQPPQRAPSPVPAEGDLLDLYYDIGCNTRPSLQAEVRYVGAGAVWLEDVDNPGPAMTEAELQSLDAFLTGKALPVLGSHFGPFEDIDSNDRALILITKEVNKEENVAGYVWGADLLPATSCARSNQAEIFYGIAPDPNGLVGSAISKDAVLERYPPLIAHELTHVVQFTGMIYGQAAEKSWWEIEGGATLNEKLVGHEVLGNSARSNLGWTAVDDGMDWYWDWVQDLAMYFGWSPSGRVAGAPEQCTWTGRPEDGNTGPCYGSSRAIYGVPAWLLQFVLDRYGPSYPGGTAAAMQRMTQSGFEGFSTLEDVSNGENIKLILTRFGSALYTDGRYLGGYSWNPIASWNLYDIFDALVDDAQLSPYESSVQEPQMDVLVRGGSTAYLLWAPGATGYNPTTLRIRTPSGNPLPDHMAYWIWRIK